jgi:hypothetical protein
MANPKTVRQAQKVINMQADASTLKPKNFVETFAGLRTKIARAAQNAVAVILKNQANQRYFYGELDNLPNTIIATVDNSGTATACIGRLEQFIKADGFQQEGLDDVKVNARQTLAGVLDEVTTNVAYLEGFALRLVFNGGGQIAKIYNVDVKTLRRIRDGFEYNPLNGEVGKSENETKFFPEFDPERDPKERLRLIAKQVKTYGEQLGEILYVFRKGLGRYYDVYPVPRYYASIEDLVSDGKISRLDLRNISQGFRTPVVISTGPIDDQNKDEDGYTAQDYFDAALEEFTGENASPILHLKGNTEEFKPTVTTINVAEILDQTDRASDRIAKRVARVMEVPDVLIGIAKEGQLGNVQEVKNQMALFALSVYKKQDLIKQAFDLLKPYYGIAGLNETTDFTLTTLKPFDFVPDAVIANLTPAEQKELFEINLEASQPVTPTGEPVQVANRNDALTNLTGKQLQGIQRIVRKFNKDELTFDQAALMLSQGFGFTTEQVDTWLITKEEEDV